MALVELNDSIADKKSHVEKNAINISSQTGKSMTALASRRKVILKNCGEVKSGIDEYISAIERYDAEMTSYLTPKSESADVIVNEFDIKDKLMNINDSVIDAHEIGTISESRINYMKFVYSYDEDGNEISELVIDQEKIDKEFRNGGRISSIKSAIRTSKTECLNIMDEIEEIYNNKILKFCMTDAKYANMAASLANLSGLITKSLEIDIGTEDVLAIYSKLWDGETINSEYLREIMNKNPDNLSESEYAALQLILDNISKDIGSDSEEVRDRALEQMELFIDCSYINPTYDSYEHPHTVTKYTLSPVAKELGHRYANNAGKSMAGYSAKELQSRSDLQSKIFISNALQFLPNEIYSEIAIIPGKHIVEISDILDTEGKRISSSKYALSIMPTFSTKKNEGKGIMFLPFGKGSRLDDGLDTAVSIKFMPEDGAKAVTIINGVVGSFSKNPSLNAIISGENTRDKLDEIDSSTNFLENTVDSDSLLDLFTEIDAHGSAAIRSDGVVKVNNVVYDRNKLKGIVDEYNKNNQSQVAQEDIEAMLNGTASKKTWDKYLDGDENKASILSSFLDTCTKPDA
jgi:hypothetical protein